MRPPICAVCRKRFDPSRSFWGGGGLLRFADYRPMSDRGPVGHPVGAEWFCRRHYGLAKSLTNRSLGEAMAVFRGRWWRAVALRLAVVLVALLAGAAAWNVTGAVELGAGTGLARARVSVGRLADLETDARGAVLAARWIETRATPTRNPLRILWQQLRYNVWTEGYDLVLWLEPPGEPLASPIFALYQSGSTVFLRVEYEGRNRVLDASFSAAELEAALEPYLTRPPLGEKVRLDFSGSP